MKEEMEEEYYAFVTCGDESVRTWVCDKEGSIHHQLTFPNNYNETVKSKSHANAYPASSRNCNDGGRGDDLEVEKSSNETTTN